MSNRRRFRKKSNEIELKSDYPFQHLWSHHKLFEEATKFGYRALNDVSGDGNCFYHSIALLMNVTFNIEFTADEIRQQIDKHKQENQHLYGPYQVIDEYDQWAYIEIMAASIIYEINIVIMRSDGADSNIFLQRNATKTFVLSYEIGLHYQPMIKDDRIKSNIRKNLIKLIKITNIRNAIFYNVKFVKESGFLFLF